MRERRQPRTRVYFSLARSKACGFMRGKPDPRGPGGLQRAGERRRGGHTACSWALVSAQTSSPGQGGSGGACSGPTEWEGRQGWRGPLASSPWQQLCTLESRAFSSEEHWLPGAFATPGPLRLASHLASACAGTLFSMAKASPSCPSQGHRQRVGPRLGMEQGVLRGCLTAKSDSLE